MMTRDLLRQALLEFLIVPNASQHQMIIDDLVERASPDTWVGVLVGLDDDELATIIPLIPANVLGDILSSADDDESAAHLVQFAGAFHGGAALSVMAADDATDLLGTLSDEETSSLLDHTDPDAARAIRILLEYPPESAGGIMTLAFIAIAPDVSAARAIDGLRTIGLEAEIRSYVYVLDSTGKLLGVLSFHDLVFAHPATPVRDLMIETVASVTPDVPSQQAAQLLRERHLLALPVVAEDGEMLGIITVDDVLDLFEDERLDAVAQYAGTDAEAMALRSPFQVAKLRMPWLLGTMAIELGAGMVISQYDGVLQRVILLTSFMPVISAVSGNVGLQSAAIVVRGLDTGFVRMDRWWRSLTRELASALMMAVCCGLVLGVIGALWSGRITFGLVIGGALLCSMLTAGAMGTVVPMISRKLGFDPAATAGPFETAFQDVVGFAVFLWLASMLIGYLE